jgi:hypothetical protein
MCLSGESETSTVSDVSPTCHFCLGCEKIKLLYIPISHHLPTPLRHGSLGEGSTLEGDRRLSSGWPGWPG